MDMCFACITAVLTNHRGCRTGSHKHKNYGYVYEIHVFDRNMCFANCLYCIKRWVIGQYASKYLDCRLFPVLYILLDHYHQYLLHFSMTILHTHAVCYNYIIVGVGYL